MGRAARGASWVIYDCAREVTFPNAQVVVVEAAGGVWGFRPVRNNRSHMSRSFELGDLIAERQMTFQPRDGQPQEISVRVGRPTRDASAPRETWVCPFQIAGIGDGKTRGIFGADAMQALLLAIHTIPVELASYARDAGGQFMRFGEPDSSFIAACRTAIRYAGDDFPS